MVGDGNCPVYLNGVLFSWGGTCSHFFQRTNVQRKSHASLFYPYNSSAVGTKKNLEKPFNQFMEKIGFKLPDCSCLCCSWILNESFSLSSLKYLHCSREFLFYYCMIIKVLFFTWYNWGYNCYILHYTIILLHLWIFSPLVPHLRAIAFYGSLRANSELRKWCWFWKLLHKC